MINQHFKRKRSLQLSNNVVQSRAGSRKSRAVFKNSFLHQSFFLPLFFFDLTGRIRHNVARNKKIGVALSDKITKHLPEEIFRLHGGQLRMNEVIKHGITRYMLYSLKDRGIIEQISRGVYRLAELAPLSNIDLTTVSIRVPNAVICLISALAYHGITTQIPHHVSFAVPRNSRLPSLDYPPIQAHRFSNQAYKAGIEQHQIDGIIVKIYSIEKTLVDSNLEIKLAWISSWKPSNSINHKKKSN